MCILITGHAVFSLLSQAYTSWNSGQGGHTLYQRGLRGLLLVRACKEGACVWRSSQCWESWLQHSCCPERTLLQWVLWTHLPQRNRLTSAFPGWTFLSRWRALSINGIVTVSTPQFPWTWEMSRVRRDPHGRLEVIGHRQELCQLHTMEFAPPISCPSSSFSSTMSLSHLSLFLRCP